MAFASTAPTGRRFTLAQFARRVKVTEGHARAMYAQKRLPRPTGFDVDSRPWWSADAIDAWCAEVGRPLPEDATQIYRWPAATEPAPVTFSEDVVVPAGWSAQTTAHVTVYDTPSGHLVWVQPYADRGVYDAPHYRHLAWAAALVLEPAMWTRAIVAVADTLMRTDEDYQPDCHALTLNPAHLDRSPSWLPEFVRSRLDDRPEPNTPRNVAVEEAGLPAVSRVARVIGRDLPLWWDGSCTPTAMRAAEAMGITVGAAYVDRSEERRRAAGEMLARLQADENAEAAELLAEERRARRAQLPKPRTATITVPDVVTGWPERCKVLTAAHAVGLGEQFPQAWGLLASSSLALYNEAREDLTHLLLCGDGWYAPARVALPEWPVPVETAARRAAVTPFDPAAGATELPPLRQAEAELPWDDAVAEGMSAAAELLAGALRKEYPEVVWAGVTGVAHLRRGRPVVEQYCDTLTPLPGPVQEKLRTRPTRRVMRLVQSERHMGAIRHYDLVGKGLKRIEAFYTDPAGRLVAAERPDSDDDGPGRIIVEWPLYPICGWTDETMIASDGDDFGVFALTPTNAGGLRVDPLPAIAESRGGHFTWGYQGSGPIALYNALCRSAIDDLWQVAPHEWLDMYSPRSRSELWHTITTTDQNGPIRLTWPQVIDWATSDYQVRR
jgi:hypothetical protein